MAQIDRKQVQLHPGPENEKTKKFAYAKLGEILRLRDLHADPSACRHTAASVIELYLEHAKARYSERSL